MATRHENADKFAITINFSAPFVTDLPPENIANAAQRTFAKAGEQPSIHAATLVTRWSQPNMVYTVTRIISL